MIADQGDADAGHPYRVPGIVVAYADAGYAITLSVDLQGNISIPCYVFSL